MSSPEETNHFVEKILKLGTQCVIVTNGGSGAISAISSVPGASRVLLEGLVPYSSAALSDFLGSKPDQYVSDRTARSMAMKAYFRAKELADANNRLAGVACTASLQSDRPKRGPHRAHLAWQTAKSTASVSIELSKGARDRRQEEEVVAQLLLNMIAEASGGQECLRPALVADERLESRRVDAPCEWQDLIAGRKRAVRLCDSSDFALPHAVLCGAFNPLHSGHVHMAEEAESILGVPVEFELSIANVDKPPLDFIEITDRSVQFASRRPLWLTYAPTFVEKAACFPGATFIVGADTIVRIADARYYRNDPSVAAAAISQIASLGCRFLVFGRLKGAEFQQLSDLSLPAELRAISQEVPVSVFREDISSTQLRQQPLREA